MNSKFQISIFQGLDMHRIVQVLGIRTVNGKSNLISQINAVFHIFFRWSIWHCFSFLKNSLWKFRDNIHRLQNFQNINPSICRMTNYIKHRSYKKIMFSTWILVDKDLKHFSSFKFKSWFFYINRLANFLIF